jgi:small GTP-binding protein
MNDTTSLLSSKVVLIGETGVGKTAIISRFIRDSFLDGQEPSTMASYISKEILIEQFNMNLKLDIWDTAGQEKYRSLTKFFYKDAAIAILVYDVTNKSSFTELSEYWTQQLMECGSENLIIGIAGNKCDMVNEEKVNETEVKELATKIGATFQLTSAKTNIGIDTLFQKLGERFLVLHNVEHNKDDDNAGNNRQRGTSKLVHNEKKKKKKCCD